MSKRELPTAVYAAAGAGDLAYQRLRKLPDTAARTLRSTAADLRRRVAEGPGLDLSRVRESAQRNAAAAAAKASSAQQKAVAGYRRLVAHGEQVIAQREARDAHVRAEPAAAIAVADSRPTDETDAETTGKPSEAD